MKIKCYDNGGKTIDRYTVVYLETKFLEKRSGIYMYECVGMNSYPFHPQGFGQHSNCILGRHLGKRIKFEELPEDCKKLVKRDLNIKE